MWSASVSPAFETSTSRPVDGRLFRRGQEPHASLPIPLWESGTPNSLKTKSPKLEQEVLDSIVDGFGSDVQAVGIDEYSVRPPIVHWTVIASRQFISVFMFSRTVT
jgi:hypothetical protein